MRHKFIEGIKMHEAYDRWVSVFGSERAKYFWKFINTVPQQPELYANSGFGYWLEPEAMGRVEMLLSPHYVALIKAYMIRDGSSERVPRIENRHKSITAMIKQWK